MTVSLLTLSALMSSHMLASTGSSGSINWASPVPLCQQSSAEQQWLPLGPQCYIARERQTTSPLQVSSAMYLLTIFKQVLQGSASPVKSGGKDEAGGWCSDPQLFWMLPVSGSLCPLP